MEQTQISSWLSNFETKLSYASNDNEHNIAYSDAIPIGADLASCMADYYIRNSTAYPASCIPAEIALDATKKYALTASGITSATRIIEQGRRRQLSFEMTPYDNDTYIEETPHSLARSDTNERYLSYQARRNIRESRMRESSDFTDTESKALDEFFAGLDVTKERLDAD